MTWDVPSMGAFLQSISEILMPSLGPPNVTWCMTIGWSFLSLISPKILMDSTTREDASSKEGGCNGILHIPKYYVLDHRDRTFLVWWLVHHMFTQRVKVKPVTKSNQSDGGGPRTHHTLIVWNDSTIPTRSIDCTSTCPALWDHGPKIW